MLTLKRTRTIPEKTYEIEERLELREIIQNGYSPPRPAAPSDVARIVINFTAEQTDEYMDEFGCLVADGHRSPYAHQIHELRAELRSTVDALRNALNGGVAHMKRADAAEQAGDGMAKSIEELISLEERRPCDTLYWKGHWQDAASRARALLTTQAAKGEEDDGCKHCGETAENHPPGLRYVAPTTTAETPGEEASLHDKRLTELLKVQNHCDKTLAAVRASLEEKIAELTKYSGNQRRVLSGQDARHALDTEAIAKLTAERIAWEQTAASYSRNSDYYRGLVDETANHLGPDVYKSDDGSIQNSPFRAKIPEMVATLSRERISPEQLTVIATAKRLRGRFDTDAQYEVAHPSLMDLIVAVDALKK
jgi:hypothetical protein